MTSDTDLRHRQALLAEVANAQADVTVQIPLVPNLDRGETPQTRHWSASLTTLLVPPEELDDDAIALWNLPGVDLDERAPQPEQGERPVTLARVSGLTLDLFEGPDAGQVFEALDTEADWEHFAALLDNTPEATVHPDLVRKLGRFPERVHIIGRAETAPAWRRLGGVGRLLVAIALAQLNDYDDIAVLHPFPLQHTGHGDHPNFHADAAAVHRVWATLGFQEWRNDIWYLDLSRTDLLETIDQLRDNLSLP